MSESSLLWASATLTFGVGDALTTLYFLTAGMNFESHPFAAYLIVEFGLGLLIPWKATILLLFYALYRVTPAQWRIGVPLGLFFSGLGLTVWNTYSSVTGARILL